MSIPFGSNFFIPCIENSDLFARVSHDKRKHETIYRLKAEKLSPDQCHIFCNRQYMQNWLVVTALEFFTFHPMSKLSDKFIVTVLKYNGSIWNLCSFPTEYADVVERAAKTYQLKIVKDPMKMMDVFEKETPSDAPALTLSEDYKERWFSGTEPEKQKPIPKDALALPTKRHVEKNIFLFPQSDNVLWLEGREVSEKEFLKYSSEISSITNTLHSLGVD